MAEYAIVKWAIAHWRALVLGALLLGLSGWHFQDKISDWLDATKIERLEKRLEAAEGRVASLEESARLQEAATGATKAAGDRNDAVLPKTRRETAGRVERAPVADAATELRDDQEAIAAYESAAGRLQGTHPR
jgi:hypothetical protein